MRAAASIFAILGWLGLGCILMGACWVLSRWLGTAAPKPGEGKAAWGSDADLSRTIQGHIAHDKGGI